MRNKKQKRNIQNIIIYKNKKTALFGNFIGYIYILHENVPTKHEINELELNENKGEVIFFFVKLNFYEKVGI